MVDREISKKKRDQQTSYSINMESNWKIQGILLATERILTFALFGQYQEVSTILFSIWCHLWQNCRPVGSFIIIIRCFIDQYRDNIYSLLGCISDHTWECPLFASLTIFQCISISKDHRGHLSSSWNGYKLHILMSHLGVLSRNKMSTIGLSSEKKDTIFSVMCKIFRAIQDLFTTIIVRHLWTKSS